MKVSPKNTLRMLSSSLNPALQDSKLQAMNFLNEVTMRFPDAISFAPGRPPENYFNVQASFSGINDFMNEGDLRHLPKAPLDGYDALGQYGRTRGVITDLIVSLLHNDEQIDADADDIVMTVGAQEGMLLCLSVLAGGPDDVALTVEPAYIGFSGAAQLLGIPVVGIASGPQGIDLKELEQTVIDLQAQGKHARLLYVSSDYANPTGLTLSIEQRVALLKMAEKLDLIIVEDTAYNYFSYEEQQLPSLKSLEGGERVICLGSFAKTLYPGLRVGYLVAGQNVVQPDGSVQRLSESFATAKSLFTVNTSPVMQAMVGGLLIAQDCSLKAFVRPRVAALKENRDAMLAALARHFPAADPSHGITWNRPQGGFFITLDMPFEVGNDQLLHCAREFNVTWTPMEYFHVATSRSRQVRFSFSYVTPREIDEGVNRFAKWFESASRALQVA